MLETLLNIVPVDLKRVTGPIDKGGSFSRPGRESPDDRAWGSARIKASLAD